MYIIMCTRRARRLIYRMHCTWCRSINELTGLWSRGPAGSKINPSISVKTSVYPMHVCIANDHAKDPSHISIHMYMHAWDSFQPQSHPCDTFSKFPEQANLKKNNAHIEMYG